MTNHFAAYRLEVRAMKSGTFYSQLVDADTDMEVWESKEYDEMEDAYDAGKHEWEARIEVDQELAHRHREGAQ